MKTINRKVKVVYILHSSSKHEGSSKSFISMLEGMIKRDVIIPYVVVPERGEICNKLVKLNIPYVIASVKLSIYPPIGGICNILLFIPRLIRTLLLNYVSTQKIMNYVKQNRPDIIHSNVGPTYIGYDITRKLDISHVWHLREYQGMGTYMYPIFSMKGFLKKLHSKNTYPIAISRGLYDYYHLDDRARIIYNGVLTANNVQFKKDKKKYFLFAGRLKQNKGIKELILAFSEFSKDWPDYNLYVAGNIENNSYCKMILLFVRQHSLTDQIKFLGVRDDIYDLMAEATALVVPSVNEGFGRITAEAMFNGCLVIGNNTTGTKEILEAEKLGILYTGHVKLIDALKAVVNNGIESYYPMIEKAQEKAVSLYSQEQNADAVYQYYQEILNKQKKIGK